MPEAGEPDTWWARAQSIAGEIVRSRWFEFTAGFVILLSFDRKSRGEWKELGERSGAIGDIHLSQERFPVKNWELWGYGELELEFPKQMIRCYGHQTRLPSVN